MPSIPGGSERAAVGCGAVVTTRTGVGSGTGQNGTRKLEGLVLVELALLEEDAEVLQDGQQGTRLHWNLLELLNGLQCVQDALV